MRLEITHLLMILYCIKSPSYSVQIPLLSDETMQYGIHVKFWGCEVCEAIFGKVENLLNVKV